MSKVLAVIFDLDGTIADTECFHREAWELTSKAFALGIPGEDIFRTSLGISSTKTLKQMLPESWDNQIPEVAEYKFQTTMRLLQGSEIRLMPGFEETYAQLCENNLSIGICTSAREANIQALMASRGKLPEILRALEGKIVWKEMTVSGKPSPEPLLLTMRVLGSPLPASVLYVGDAAADYTCSQSAGTQYLHFAEDDKNLPSELMGKVTSISDHRRLLEHPSLIQIPDVEL